VPGLILPAEEWNTGLLLKSPRLLLSEYGYLFTRGTAAVRETNCTIPSKLRMGGIILSVSHTSPQRSP